MGSSRKWLKLLSSKKKISSVSIERVSASEKSKRWKFWKSFHLFSKNFPRAEKEPVVCGTGKKIIVNPEERAAVIIQTAFRVFLAKKALRALKGLVRLQAAINGHETRKQSSASLQCIRAFVRVQARIRRQRRGKGEDALGLSPQDLPRLIVENYAKADSEMDWCNTRGTVEEVQAKKQQRQVAAIKRERAIAYAFCNKWKANTKINPGSLFDYELDNSIWIWFWLDEWLNGQPKKVSIPLGNSKQNVQIMKQTVGSRKKNISRNTSMGSIQSSMKSKGSPCSSCNELTRVAKQIGSPSRFRLSRSLSGGKRRGVKGLPLKSAAILESGKSNGQAK